MSQSPDEQGGAAAVPAGTYPPPGPTPLGAAPVPGVSGPAARRAVEPWAVSMPSGGAAVTPEGQPVRHQERAAAGAGLPEQAPAQSGPPPEIIAMAPQPEVPRETIPAATAPESRKGPARPAAQVAPALIAVMKSTDGNQQVTVRLDPAELGQVQIRIEHTPAGSAHVSITVERPATLRMLESDQTHLRQALDQAGVAQDGRIMSFQIATPDQVQASAPRADGMAAGTGHSGHGHGGGGSRHDGDAPRGRGSNPESRQGHARPGWLREGLDITA